MLEPIPVTKNGSDLIKASAAVSFIATVWVILRVYSRRMKGVDLHLEDYMIFGALVRNPRSWTSATFTNIRCSVLSLCYTCDDGYR
jgi:hypothetical protein